MRVHFKKQGASRDFRHRTLIRQSLTFHCRFFFDAPSKHQAQALMTDILRTTAKQQELKLNMLKFTNRIV